MNIVTIEQNQRTVELKNVHIESDFAYIHNSQVVDLPKERNNEKY